MKHPRDAKRKARGLIRDHPDIAAAVTPVKPGPQGRFRPMTPDPLQVQIPKVRKIGKTGPPPKPRSTRFILTIPVHEKEELARVARDLCISQATLVRLAYKRFMRMPEPPLSKNARTLWIEGIRRDRKAVTLAAKWEVVRDRVRMERQGGYARELSPLERTLLEETDAHGRSLSRKRLTHKIMEVLATRPYRSVARQTMKPGRLRETPGNPTGKGGYARRPVDRDTDEADQRVADHDGRTRTADERDGVPRVRPTPTPTRRLMIPKK